MNKKKFLFFNYHLSLITLPGFTLVELLVVIFIMAIIATVASDVLLSVFRSSNKANILNEVNQNADFVLNSLEATMRNAKKVVTPSGVNLNSVQIIDQYNQSNFYCLITGAVNYLGKSTVSCSSGVSSLTNTNPVTGVNVVQAGTNFSVSASSPPLVCLNLELKQAPTAPGRIDYNADRTFQKCFELRKY